MKELQEKQAEEHLAARLVSAEQRNLKLSSQDELKTKAAFNVYRTPVVHIEGEQKLNEVHDPLDEEKAGALPALYTTDFFLKRQLFEF